MSGWPCKIGKILSPSVRSSKTLRSLDLDVEDQNSTLRLLRRMAVRWRSVTRFDLMGAFVALTRT